MNRDIKNTLTKILIILLISVFAVSCLVACNKDKNGGNSGNNQQGGSSGGNSDTPQREKKPITEEGYGAALYDIIKDVVNQKVSQDLPQVLATMEATSNQADTLLKAALYDNDEYLTLKNIFVNQKAELVNAILNIANEKSSDADTELLYNVVLDYYDVMGKDNFAGFVYDMVLYELEYDYYDRERKDAGLGQHRESTDEAFDDWQAFKCDVPKKDFSNFFNNTILVMELLNEKKTDQGTFELTNAEMADIVKKPDFTCDIKDSGWRVIVKKIGSFFADDTFVGMVYAEAHESQVGGEGDKGVDLDTLASKMNNIVAIAQFAQTNIDANDIGLIREDLDAYLVSLFNKMALKADIWAYVENIANTRFAYDYKKVAASYYQKNDTTKYNDFTSVYANRTVNFTVNNLKTVTKANLHDVLEDVVAGISPAFSYKMFED